MGVKPLIGNMSGIRFGNLGNSFGNSVGTTKIKKVQHVPQKKRKTGALGVNVGLSPWPLVVMPGSVPLPVLA